MKIFDNSFRSNNINLIAGVDEVGRGPLAGPVVSAAVVLPADLEINGVNDSKKLSPAKREELFEIINEYAISVGIGIVEHDTIDEINILQATLQSMKIAVNNLDLQPDLILVDGNKTFYTDTPITAIVKGDSKSQSIAAASIIAKVTRDRLMVKASINYPKYLWHKNKGYGSKEHIEAIRKFGPSPLHRKSFLSNILGDLRKETLFE